MSASPGTRFILATVAGMVTIALLGTLLYGVLFKSFIAANLISPDVMKRPPEVLWIALAHLPFSLLLTLLVSWRRATARGGAVTGAILGLLMAASYDLSQYGTSKLWTLQLTLVDPLISMALVGGAGAVVGLVLGRRQRSP